jgi:hypothetical protein
MSAAAVTRLMLEAIISLALLAIRGLQHTHPMSTAMPLAQWIFLGLDCQLPGTQLSFIFPTARALHVG